MLSNIKAVIFDLDGTLYDSRWLPVRLIWALAMDVFRVKADRDVRNKLKGIDFGSPEAYKAEYSRLVAKRTNLKPKDALNWYSNRYVGTMSYLLKRYYPSRPHAAEVFADLHGKGIKLAVFSDYPRIHQRMRALDFTNETLAMISGEYSAEDFGAQKPSPRPFLEIARQLGVLPEECLVVGDRDDTDGEGARKSGMQFVQIETHKTKVIEPNHPVWSWNDFSEWVLSGMEPLQD